MKKNKVMLRNSIIVVAMVLFMAMQIGVSAQEKGEKNWTLTGNNLSGTEFIGSINNKPFVFKTNNLERLRIDALGNVGIGVINASEKLEIAGGLKLRAINPGNSANGTIVYNGSDFLIRKNNQWMSLMYKSPWDTNSVSVFTNRNVGLGVDSPKESLELDGAIRFHSYNKGRGKDEMEDGTVFYDGTNILAKVDGKIDTLTDNGTTPPQEEFLWRKNAPRTNYTFFNVGIGTNTADKPLHILGKIGSVPTMRFTHKYIIPSINPEYPLDSMATKDSPKAPGDTIIKDADIWSANGGLFFTVEGHPADFGFTHSTMQSRVRFLCDKSIMTRNNLFVWNSVSIGEPTGSWNNPPAQLYVNGNSLMNGNLSVGDNVKIYSDGKMWVKNTIKVNVDKPGGWGDFVFEPDYKLKSLQEVEMYVNEHKHLEGVPDAKTIDAEGIDLGAMTNILTQKMEEMTLYMIEQNKKIEELQMEIIELKKGKR